MKVLVLGGTRFTGKAVVRHLAEGGHKVTVISRRPGKDNDRIRYVTGERDTGLARLRGSVFDACLDFICYDADQVRPVFDNLDPGQYSMVSSTWLPRLDISTGKSTSILPATREYLNGKAAAEKEISKLRDSGKSATIVRLPLTLGKADHTGRCRFYLDRMADSQGLILINGGHNLAQIAWKEDVANVLVRWLDSGLAEGHLLWEALPDAGASVKTIMEEMAGELTNQFVEISEQVLLQRLPQYLEDEPLWRESEIPITDHNIFQAVGLQPTPRREWLSALPRSITGDHFLPTRNIETTLMKEFDRA